MEKYQLLEQIGQGSNGIVKKCRVKGKDAIYAVKRMKLDVEDCSELKKNFRMISNLSHENIISYKAIYLDIPKRVCHLVMDYEEMPNLSKAKNLTGEELQEIMKQLFETLEYLHSKNICHRDIKPDNILYDREKKKIKLIDFGISRKVFEKDEKKSLLSMTGSLFYRAP